MKNLQTWILKFVLTFPLVFCLALASAQSERIKVADSLFRAKQYTQSLEIYQSIFDHGKYSPAILLKMAYIQEGLGKIGPTIYYLKLYHLATNDEQALRKLEELASKFKLSGYEVSDASQVQQWISKKIGIIQLGLGIILLLASYGLFISKRKMQKPWLSAAIIILTSSSIFYLNNFFTYTTCIVNFDHTYVMGGPSSGAPVTGVLAEGNQLELLGEKDVWIKVKWLDKIGYVKKNSVLTVTL